MANTNVRMRAAKESYLLLSPDMKKNSHEVAKRIAACKGVRKVTITTGEVAFVVSTAENGDSNSERISRIANRVLGRSRVRIAKGHYAYARTP